MHKLQKKIPQHGSMHYIPTKTSPVITPYHPRLISQQQLQQPCQQQNKKCIPAKSCRGHFSHDHAQRLFHGSEQPQSHHVFYLDLRLAIKEYIGGVVPLERQSPIEISSDGIGYVTATGVIQGTLIMYTGGQGARHNSPVIILSKLKRHFFSMTKARRAKVHTVMGESVTNWRLQTDIYKSW